MWRTFLVDFSQGCCPNVQIIEEVVVVACPRTLFSVSSLGASVETRHF